MYTDLPPPCAIIHSSRDATYCPPAPGFTTQFPPWCLSAFVFLLPFVPTVWIHYCFHSPQPLPRQSFFFVPGLSRLAFFLRHRLMAPCPRIRAEPSARWEHSATTPEKEKGSAGAVIADQIESARADLILSTETTMSNPRLPAETLDHIVDYLRDKKDALRNCGLVSKSWIPCTRKHIFTDVVFASSESLQLWKETFPDPLTSPACYAKTLFIGCAQVVTAVDAEAGGWIRGFSRVVHLVVRSQALLASKSFSFVPFHGLSPAINSLRVSAPALPSSRIIGLILSFPLLEDLAVTTYPTTLTDDDNNDNNDRLSTTVLPSNSPIFTGTLELFLGGGFKSFTYRLSSLPGGIPFRKFTLTCFRGSDLVLAVPLIEGCSHTLKSLDIACNLHCTSSRHRRPHRYLTSLSRRGGVNSD
jgi:hypothetical protein